jgi:hypothetical protein
MPFILASWLISASQRLLLRATVDCAPWQKLASSQQNSLG